MQGVSTFLSFRDKAEEAVNLYVSVIPNSGIASMMKSADDGPIARGKVLHAFSFADGTSLFLTCDTQEEIDRIWNRLTENGGKPGPCGWLIDPYGLSWQVVPAALGEMIGDPENGNAKGVIDAMLKMGKLDIAELRRAYTTPVETSR